MRSLLVLLLLLCFAPRYADAQPMPKPSARAIPADAPEKYRSNVEEGRQALKARDYNAAINKFTVAGIYDVEKKFQENIRLEIEAVLKAVEDDRDFADESRKKVLAEQQNAQRQSNRAAQMAGVMKNLFATLTADTLDQTLALRLAEYNLKSALHNPGARSLFAKLTLDATRRYYQHTFAGHPGPAQAAAVSPDGALLLTADEQSVKLWRPDQPDRPLRVLPHPSRVTALAYSPDGLYFATGTADGQLRLWSAAKPESGPIKTIAAHTAAVMSLCFSPDSRRLLSAGDRTAKLWKGADQADLTPVATFEGHAAPIHAAVFSKDGALLATAGADNQAVLWKTEQPTTPLASFAHPGGVRSVAILSANKNQVEYNAPRLLTACADGGVRLWSAAQPAAPLAEYRDHTAAVNQLLLSPDGRMFLSAGDDRGIKLWRVGAPERPALNFLGHETAVLALAASADGRFFAAVDATGTAKWWRIRQFDSPLYAVPNLKGAVLTTAFSSNGRYFLSGGEDKNIHIWSLERPDSLVTLLKGHKRDVLSAVFAPDNRHVLSGSSDFTVKWWSLERPDSALLTLKGHAAAVNAVAISPNGKHALTGSDDKTALWWQLDRPESPLATLNCHKAPVKSVAISPNGKLIATGSVDERVRIWEIGKFDKPIDSLTSPDGSVIALAFSPDSRSLLIGTRDNNLRLWSLKPTRQVVQLDAQQREKESIMAVDFSRDGRYFIVASWGKTVQLRRTAYPDENILVLRPETSVTGAAISPDGYHIAVVGRSGQAELWYSLEGWLKKGVAPVPEDRLKQAGVVSFPPTVTIDGKGETTPITPKPAAQPIPPAAKEDYKRNVEQGRASLKARRFKDAINAFTKALYYDSRYAADIRLEMKAVLDAVEEQKARIKDDEEKAATAAEVAKKQQKNAEEGAEVMQNLLATLSADTFNHTLAYRLAEYNAKRHPASALANDYFNKIAQNTTRRYYHAAFENHEGLVRAAVISPDGQYLLTGDDNTARIWRLDQPEISIAEFPHKAYVNATAFSPNGQYFVTGGSRDYTVRLWDVSRPGKEPLRECRGHGGPIASLAFSSDGKWILSAGTGDKTAKLWWGAPDAPDSTISTYRGHRDDVTWAVFSPDNQLIATASDDASVLLWQVDQPGKPLRNFKHPDAVKAVVFSPDGRQLLTACSDQIVRLWNIDQPDTCVAQYRGHKGIVNMVAFAPDGRHFLSSGEDRTIKIWKSEQPQAPAATCHGHRTAVKPLSFTPDGRLFVSGGADHTVKLWPLEPDGEIARVTPNDLVSAGAVLERSEMEALTDPEALVAAARTYFASGDTVGAHRLLEKCWAISDKDVSRKQLYEIGLALSFEKPLSYFLALKDTAGIFDMADYFARRQINTEAARRLYLRGFELDKTNSLKLAEYYTFCQKNKLPFDRKLLDGLEADGLYYVGKRISSGSNWNDTRYVYEKALGKQARAEGVEKLQIAYDSLGLVLTQNHIGRIPAEDSLGLLRLGSFFQQRARWKDAYAAYKQGLAFAPRLDEMKELYKVCEKDTTLAFPVELATKFNNPNHIYEMADYLRRRSKWEGARQLYEAGLSREFQGDKLIDLYYVCESGKMPFDQNRFEQLVEPDHIFLLAERFRRQEQYEKARIWFEKGLDKRNDPNQLFRLHEMCEKHKLPFDEKRFNSLENPTDIFRVADYFRGKNKWKQAYDFYDKGLARKADPNALLKQYEVAEKGGLPFNFDRLLALEDPNTLLKLGKKFESQAEDRIDRANNATQLRKALRVAERLLQVQDSPTHRRWAAQVCNGLAWNLFFLQEWKEAEKVIRQGLDWQESNEWLHSNLPHALLFQGKIKKAEEEYLKWENTPFTADDNKEDKGLATFKEAFLSDFEEFEKAGLVQPNDPKIERVRQLLQQ